MTENRNSSPWLVLYVLKILSGSMKGENYFVNKNEIKKELRAIARAETTTTTTTTTTSKKVVTLDDNFWQ